MQSEDKGKQREETETERDEAETAANSDGEKKKYHTPVADKVSCLESKQSGTPGRPLKAASWKALRERSVSWGGRDTRDLLRINQVDHSPRGEKRKVAESPEAPESTKALENKKHSTTGSCNEPTDSRTAKGKYCPQGSSVIGGQESIMSNREEQKDSQEESVGKRKPDERAPAGARGWEDKMDALESWMKKTYEEVKGCRKECQEMNEGWNRRWEAMERKVEKSCDYVKKLEKEMAQLKTQGENYRTEAAEAARRQRVEEEASLKEKTRIILREELKKVEQKKEVYRVSQNALNPGKW